LKQDIYVGEQEGGVRIDKYLADTAGQLSRSYIQKLLKEGRVLVNGKTVKASYVVEDEDVLSMDIPEAVEPEIEPEAMELDILYEDDDVILINKPKGMVVHPAAGHYSHTLVNGLMYHCLGNLSGINGVLRPGIVHRIDMDTTGVLIVCKNDMAHNSIAAQLKEHSITRRYQAIVHGVIKEDEGSIDAPIGRHPVERKKMSINYNNGKPAVTHYKVLTRFKDFTHVECRLETGRTHQIRVHMASIRHPLLGDCVYGPARCPVPGLTGQTLHAGVLGFIHPRTGAYMEFSAPLPDYFSKLLRTLP
jgi:23S rRNA pseudouridine1911/1915/1917 synthase